MRSMSFMLTTDQIRSRTKTVTRRDGWGDLLPGTLLRAVVKCQGLRRGEKMRPLAIIRVVSVRREPLSALLDNPPYGLREVALEGFANHDLFGWPTQWVDMFCWHHPGCTPETEVTRIEFRYIPGGRLC
ncbi:MAG: ASCH domain-containing protein [Planctomycetaceae bacterium]|nr:ASCH domain-containing protein [Planctomycetaceae bacterium]